MNAGEVVPAVGQIVSWEETDMMPRTKLPLVYDREDEVSVAAVQPVVQLPVTVVGTATTPLTSYAQAVVDSPLPVRVTVMVSVAEVVVTA